MPTKVCFKCHTAQPRSEFYPHPQMADGHLNKCKRCTRKDVQENRAMRREQYKLYDRSRHNAERRKMIALSRARLIHRDRARRAVANALTRGRLERQPCEVCGDAESQAHHEDYRKPLEVRWLCRIHHGMVHRVDADRRLTLPPVAGAA